MDHSSKLDTLLKEYHKNQSIDKPDGRGHAVGYIRVSTDLQVKDGSSLESQTQQIIDYCKYTDLILDKIYEDAAKSGSDRERTGLSDMINDLTPNTKVVTYSIDRIARDTVKLLEIKEQIHIRRCSMYIIDRRIDTGDSSSELLVTIMAAVADENRKAQNRTISSVMQDMSSKGKLRGRPKYGWKMENNLLVEDPNEQLVINIIREMIIADPTICISRICSNLTHAGINIRKSKKVYPAAIKNIIINNKLRPEL